MALIGSRRSTEEDFSIYGTVVEIEIVAGIVVEIEVFMDTLCFLRVWCALCVCAAVCVYFFFVHVITCLTVRRVW